VGLIVSFHFLLVRRMDAWRDEEIEMCNSRVCTHVVPLIFSFLFSRDFMQKMMVNEAIRTKSDQTNPGLLGDDPGWWVC